MTPDHVGVVIDGDNLAGQLRSIGGARMDISAFIRYCRGLGPLRGMTWFQADLPANQSFFAFLRRQPEISLRTAKPIRRADGTIKCDLDVAIAVESLRLAETCETILFVTGDGDFLQVITPLLNKGRRVIVMSHQSALDARYRQVIKPWDLLDLEHELPHFSLEPTGKPNHGWAA